VLDHSIYGLGGQYRFCNARVRTITFLSRESSLYFLVVTLALLSLCLLVAAAGVAFVWINVVDLTVDVDCRCDTPQ
jgi:hypothetical protein